MEDLRIINILENCINKRVKDIYVTGYSEVRDDFNFFSAMLWWYYIEFENHFLCLESNEAVGMLDISLHQKIRCNFEIEDGDIFTVTSIYKESNSELIGFDLFYGRDDLKPYALGI